jgi:ATP-dependent 26S proteasome regulatory subunit
MKNEVVLTPSQQCAFNGLLEGISVNGVVVLRGDAGRGKSTVLQHLHETAGGILLGIAQFTRSLSDRHPLAIEETFLRVVEDALEGYDLVIVDDLSRITDITEACNYRRENLLDAMLVTILNDADARGKKLVFAVDNAATVPVALRALNWFLGDFTPEDYQAVCRVHLGAEIAGRLDFARIHRFAPGINAHQLKKACLWLRRERGLDTARFLEYLSSQNLTSNVELEQVEPVRWDDLKGVDDVIRELEMKVALPFENDALAAELKLKPKRGILLSGPPGTGKTTIGRALAHRLKGKFFLIDGTMVAGSHLFYTRFTSIFEAAKRNAPSVLFIDDADVIFEGEGNRDFERYLLTILDGMESAGAERVCVMMTAMNPSNLPAALVRSGRIELWLETRLPDEDARASILREKLAGLPAAIGDVDVALVAAAARGLTGADLKSVVEDAKLAFAHDQAYGRIPAAAEEYFFDAVERVRNNRRNYSKPRRAPMSEVVTLGFKVE